MNVLICGSELYPKTPKGGIGVCVNNVAEYLRKEGICCDVCSPFGPEIRVPLEFLGKNYGVFSLLSFWQKVSRKIKDDVSDYDVVWLHQPFFIGKFPFNKCLVTMHTSIIEFNKVVQNNGFSTYDKLYYNLREKIEVPCIKTINSYASYFSVVSPHIGNSLEEIDVPRKKIIYIPNGVDTSKFKPSPKKSLRAYYGIAEDDIVFTYIGRMTDQKRPLTLIRMFAKLTKELDNVCLVLAGDGKLLNDAKKLVSHLGLSKVLFLGYVDDSQLPSVYALSDFYFMASIYEGQPITTLEAMASGIPLIGPDLPALNLIVKGSNSGITLDYSKTEDSLKATYTFFEN